MTSQAPNASMGGNSTPGSEQPPSRSHPTGLPGSSSSSATTASSNFGSGSGGFADFSSYSQPNSYTNAGGGPGTLARVSSATVENPSPTADTAPDSYDRFGHGHYFSKKTFHKPTYCHHCTDMLWGIIGQGFICEGTALGRFALPHLIYLNFIYLQCAISLFTSVVLKRLCHLVQQ